MLRAVIFDMDGVIVDSQPYHFAVEDKMCREMGIDVSMEESHSFVGMAGAKVWGYLKNKHALPESIEELLAYYAALESAFCDASDPCLDVHLSSLSMTSVSARGMGRWNEAPTRGHPN